MEMSTDIFVFTFFYKYMEECSLCTAKTLENA